MLLSPTAKDKRMELAADRMKWVLCVLRTLGQEGVLRLLGSLFFSVNHYYILGINLVDLCEEQAQKPVALLQNGDVVTLQRHLPMLEMEDKRDLLSRIMFYGSGFTNCYAIKQGGDIAFIQWIIFPSENPVIAKTYSKKFLPLKPQQVMIENAFTFPRYRGKGYLFEGTTQLLHIARNLGYKWAICYIRKDRITSLNDFCRMGFRIRRLVTEIKVLGHVWRRL